MEVLGFTEQHKQYRQQLKEYLKREIIDHINTWEADHLTPKSAWQKIGAAGYLCPWVKPEYGGMGGDFLHSLIVIEEFTRTNHTGLLVNLHNDIVVPYIDSFGTEAQKHQYLPGCVSGDIISAVAMTEPDAGSDLASMGTTAVEDGDEIIIEGSKTFISNGINCDLVIVAAKDPSEPKAHKAISLYLVEDGTQGFKKGSKFEKMGMHSQDTAELFFTNCRIPKDNMLGKKGHGFVMLMQKLQQERLVCAIQALACAEFVLDWLVDFCRNPPSKLPALSASQAVQFAIAEMATDVEIGRTFLYKLVADHIEKQNVVLQTSMAKFWMTDMTKRISSRALSLIGEFGAHEKCPIVRSWRDAQVWSILAGTNEIMKAIIFNELNK
ncbi:MAG: acyl-CoA dehydrogenase family protein [Desulfobacterales bacterium]|jgi:alkylation response protein AidB-like acyl-CoA dehydrogenase|nr:acyl-CoA dehydrogenase family protein [Desulfobacterales bacterium]